ncbi:MAG: hypothetical protein ACI89W_001528, partial [Gammaproteobacteria bacterium]
MDLGANVKEYLPDLDDGVYKGSALPNMVDIEETFLSP